MIAFPQRSDYPDGLSLLDNPYEDINLYMRLFVSSASAYFETDPITNHFFKKRFSLIDTYLKETLDQKTKKAVDIGCGIGFFLPTLATHAEKVVGLDYTPDVLVYAKYMIQTRKITNVSFVEGSITSLPLKDNSFDLVVCMSVLEHFENPEEPLSELKRITAPRGILIVGYPTETPSFHFLHNTMTRLMPKRRKIEKIFEKEQPDETFHAPHVANAKMIQKAIENVGLKENERKSIKLIPPFLELYRINFLQIPRS